MLILVHTGQPTREISIEIRIYLATPHSYFFLISLLDILVLKYPHELENNQHRAFTLIISLILGFWGWQVWYIFLYNNIRWSCEIYCIKKTTSNHIPHVNAFNVNTCIHAIAFMQFTSYKNSDSLQICDAAANGISDG